MAKLQYPVTIDYVKDWGVAQALREIISNGIDAEKMHGAELRISYSTKTKTLSVSNAGVTLEPSALYFGGTTKTGKDLIGQYGEGLKLALLIFAREKMDVRIKNGRKEDWRPGIERDKLGIESFYIDIRGANRSTEDFVVDIGGIDLEAWHLIQSMFLRLFPSKRQKVTDYGTRLDDPDFVGKIFVKGVYVATRPGFDHGYDFTNLELGRDRRCPADWEIESQISLIWNQLVKEDPTQGVQLYQNLENGHKDAQVFEYNRATHVSDAFVKIFKERHGDDAIPIKGSMEGAELDHLGIKTVLVRPALANLLRASIPSPQDIAAQKRFDIIKHYHINELEEDKRQLLVEVVECLRQLPLAIVQNVVNRITVCDFRDTNILGLHNDEGLFIAKKAITDYGSTMMVLIHELAHDHGGDGSKSHVDAMHTLTVAVLNARRKDQS